MSDTNFYYVPEQPIFVPTKEAADNAVLWLRTKILAQSITAQVTDHPEFFHGFGNWDGVFCPACGADAKPWWSDAMSAAFDESRFDSLDVTASCCNATVSLNHMRYGWPAAFGRFSIEAEITTAPNLNLDQLDELGRLIGCTMREIIMRI